MTTVTEGLLDRDVVERARSGDQEAFADLVHQVSDTLLAVARRILRDPSLAEDVLQNALLTIWRKLPHLRDADHFEGWAFRILVHACYADAPRNRRWASTIRVLHADVASDIDDIQTISDRDELERAFRRLPLDQRAVFVLHHHVGLPLVAVAETLGIPDGTARSRLHYATRALRAAFEAARASDARTQTRTTRMNEERDFDRAVDGMAGRRLGCDTARGHRRRLAGRQEHAQERDFRVPWRTTSMHVIPTRCSRHRPRRDGGHCRDLYFRPKGIRVRRNERHAIAEPNARDGRRACAVAPCLGARSSFARGPALEQHVPYRSKVHDPGRRRTRLGEPISLMFTVVADPLTGVGCEAGPAPADAEALVQTIRSNS